MQRICVIGTSASGKTTLARAIADRLGVTHHELDAIHWGPNWTPVSKDLYNSKIQAVIVGESWTLCGNYSSESNGVFARADTIIWLDYPMSVVLWRALSRTFRRCWNREVLWADNREDFYRSFLTRESIVLWVWNTWRRRRRDYPKLLRRQAGFGKRVLRFRTPRDTERWLALL